MSPTLYFLAALTLGGAVGAMGFRNPVHCALCLVVTFVGLAGLYLGLGAQFLGLAQVLVYVGAVAILLVFVLLLTRPRSDEPVDPGGNAWISGIAMGVLVAVALGSAVFMEPFPLRSEASAEPPGTREIGHALMTDFVMPLQVVGLLLTAAMIGAAILALHERGPGRRGDRS